MGSALVTQQLAEFLAIVSARPDAASANRAAVERAARALEAEVAVVVGDYGVVSAVGFATGAVPNADLAEVVAGRRTELTVPGAGACATIVAPIGGSEPRHLVVARSGDDGYTVDEVSLVRGMARVLELTVETLYTLEAERRQAAENARLLVTLQERQRLLEQLSAIQRAIARREPLQQILDTITRGAAELLGEELVGLRLRDADDGDQLLLVSNFGLPGETARVLWRVPVAQAGVAGEAVMRDDLVVVDGYEEYAHGLPELVRQGVHAAMAAPVHENGEVVGSLIVASRRPDRVYPKTDQEVLRAFAEHVSLAVTDAKTLEAMNLAFHDSLTGLASRALFMDRLDHALAVADRDRQNVAVLFVDLDRFKIVNDSLGHAAGDHLLKGVADRLRASLRGTDTAARFGGDEFAVLLHNAHWPEQASVVAKRIIDALQEPFVISGRECFIGSSIGIAVSSIGQRDAEALMQDADLAMYEAKRTGKGRYILFEPALRESLRESVDLESDLRRALDRDEFILRYQPIVELSSGRVAGVEALIRWEHPERGTVPPLDFIPLAEDTGLILPIGRWVLREACGQVNRWNIEHAGRPALTVSVNLSACQLRQPELPAVVAEVLAETGLDPSCLVLEITESVLVQDKDAAARQLRELKTLGVRLAVDDFGTGYSSLAYLRQFPVDIIKIDKSFIDEIGRGPKAAALTSAIVRLGQTLELSTVAEGIEQDEQYGELRNGGCELGQGYFFAKPMEFGEIESMLRDPAAAAA